MQFTTGILAGIAAVMLFIQPCPAPLAVIPAAIAGADAAAVAAGAGVVAAGAGVVQAGAAVAQAAKAKVKRGQYSQPAPSVSTTGSSAYMLIQNCMADIFSNAGSITSNVTGSNGVVMHNAPQSCKDVVDDYNSSPDLAQMSALYGTVAWTDGSITTYPRGQQQPLLARQQIAD